MSLLRDDSSEINALSKSNISLVLPMFLAIKIPSESPNEQMQFFVKTKKNLAHASNSLLIHRQKAQKAWSKLMSQELSKSQRKAILESMTSYIAPWFSKVELLMDFLTDSFNVGGSTSLLALSGLYYLIVHKNLDYPSFYTKLYSLLDADILHSRHRSRFFRLLDTFLASTHLPAVLVASFIKRLSRLCLYGPPAATVAVVPWIYNLLKTHPTCTWMLHRNSGYEPLEEQLWGDPFKVEELDPMKTDALGSSLWEMHTLQTHYHPNAAAVAKVLSEQFTKQAYNIEDFLDHSYSTMIDMEMKKSVKKAPAVEYEIPKKILARHDPASGKADSLLVKLWDFS